MNIKIKLLFFAFISLGIIEPSVGQNIQFAQTSLANLHKARKQLDKPILLYLYEEDCSDCLRMERLTFSDPELSSVVSSNMLPAKVDFNTNEGLAIKKKYKISLAPALIFFDKKGKPILQQETGMSSSEMLKVLDVLYGFKIDLSKSELATQRFEVLSNAELELPAKIGVISIPDKKIKSKRESIIQKPRKTIIVKAAPKEKTDNSGVIKTKSKTSPDIGNVIIAPPESKAVLVNDVTEYKSIVKKGDEVFPKVIEDRPVISKSIAKKKDRIVQLGAYLKYDDVLKRMYKMKRKVDISLTIIEETTNGKPMYKLVSSEIMTKTDAQKLHQSFKGLGIETFIRKAI